jgi:hypothetical protein
MGAVVSSDGEALDLERMAIDAKSKVEKLTFTNSELVTDFLLKCEKTVPELVTGIDEGLLRFGWIFDCRGIDERKLKMHLRNFLYSVEMMVPPVLDAAKGKYRYIEDWMKDQAANTEYDEEHEIYFPRDMKYYKPFEEEEEKGKPLNLFESIEKLAFKLSAREIFRDELMTDKGVFPSLVLDLPVAYTSGRKGTVKIVVSESGGGGVLLSRHPADDEHWSFDQPTTSLIRAFFENIQPHLASASFTFDMTPESGLMISGHFQCPSTEGELDALFMTFVGMVGEIEMRLRKAQEGDLGPIQDANGFIGITKN